MNRDLRIPGIIRGPEIHVTVNGRKITAFQGETLLAALTAAGMKTLGIGQSHDDTRGAVCGMGVCYQCLMTIDGQLDQRACMTVVHDGMTIETQGDLP